MLGKKGVCGSREKINGHDGSIRKEDGEKNQASVGGVLNLFCCSFFRWRRTQISNRSAIINRPEPINTHKYKYAHLLERIVNIAHQDWMTYNN